MPRGNRTDIGENMDLKETISDMAERLRNAQEVKGAEWPYMGFNVDKHGAADFVFEVIHRITVRKRRAEEEIPKQMLAFHTRFCRSRCQRCLSSVRLI